MQNLLQTIHEKKEINLINKKQTIRIIEINSNEFKFISYEKEFDLKEVKILDENAIERFFEFNYQTYHIYA